MMDLSDKNVKGGFVVLPDGACDLSPDVCKAFGLTDYLPCHYSVNGDDRIAYMNWEEHSREEFYSTLSSRKNTVTSSPASPAEFEEKFRAYAEAGVKVLSISLTSAISSTFDVAKKAAEKVTAEVEGAEIVCLDSYRMSCAFGLLVLYALELQAAGKSFQEVIDTVEAKKYTVHQMGPIDDLMFVARRGRISTGKAIMGSFAGVKPMGDCNATGYCTVLGKAKGIRKALDATVAYVEKTVADPANDLILIGHSDREEYANLLKEKLVEKLHPARVLMTEVYPGCGPNIGPGMIGVYYFGSPVSADMAPETAVMNEVLGK